MRLAFKGAVIKYGADRGGRDLAGPSNFLSEKCWANKLFYIAKMGHETLT